MELPVVIPKGPLTADLRRDAIAAIANANDLIPTHFAGVFVAVVGHEKTTVTAAWRVAKGWTLSAEAEAKWSGKVSGQLKIVGVW